DYRDHHHGDVGGRRVLLELGQDLPAIQLWERDVERDRNRPQAPCLLESLRTVSRDYRLVSGRLKVVDQQLDRLWVVFNHQYQRSSSGAGRLQKKRFDASHLI